MTFNLTIETGGAAFEEDPGAELRRILQDLASTARYVITDRAPGGAANGNLRDANGNTVGSWSYQPGPAPFRFRIVADEDYDPATSVDWDEAETAAYVARFESGDLAAFGVIVERGDKDASLWGVDVATSSHTVDGHTYARDEALDVVEIDTWYSEDSDEARTLLALSAERSYLAEVLRENIAEVTE